MSNRVEQGLTRLRGLVKNAFTQALETIQENRAANDPRIQDMAKSLYVGFSFLESWVKNEDIFERYLAGRLKVADIDFLKDFEEEALARIEKTERHLLGLIDAMSGELRQQFGEEVGRGMEAAYARMALREPGEGEVDFYALLGRLKCAQRFLERLATQVKLAL